MGAALLENLGEHLFLKHLQLRWISIKAGFIGRNDLKKLFQLVRLSHIEPQKIVILIKILEIQLLKPVPETIFQQIFAVVRDVDTTLCINEIPQANELLIRNLEFLAKGNGLGKREDIDCAYSWDS